MKSLALLLGAMAIGFALDASAQRGPGSGPAGLGGRMGGPAPGLAVAQRRAERMAGIESRSYVLEETGEKMEYAVFVSRKVRKNKPSPLVIALHGLGMQPAMIVSQIRDEADKHGYIVVAPMGYSPSGGYGAYPMGLGNPPNPQASILSERDVLNVLRLALEEFNVDERRIYILGQSMGGAGALHLGPKYSGIWAAVGATAPAVGNGEPVGLENVRHLPFIIVHGDADPGVPVERSRRWVAKFKELGITYKYYEIRGGGHSDAIFTGAPRVFDFFNKHLKPAPP